MTLRFAPYRLALCSAVLTASLALATFPAAFGQTADQSPYPGTVVEDIVARVNDQVITNSDYKRAEQDLDQQAQQHQWTEQQLFDAKRNLLRDLIDQQLLLSRGKQLGITGDNELILQLDQMRKQNHLASIDDLQKAAEAQGVSWEDFKASLRNRIITQQVVRDEVGARVRISPTEVNEYYEQHKQDFAQPEQVRLSEILIPTADPDNATQVADAQKKADSIEAQLRSGGDFVALAEANSSGVTASTGGDLGQFKRGQLAKVLEDQTFDLKPGQFTEPIRTKQGYVILKVTEHNAGGIPPEKDVENQIEEQIGMSKMDPALRQYLTEQRESAYIVVRDGYEDSGASPNEMKPVYSAYKPPTRKKKKHVERTRFNTRGRKASAQPAVETVATTPGTTMKPGKKEKIRFGQAPRETLPPAQTQTEDAAANTAAANPESAIGTQTATNSQAAVLLPNGQAAATEQTEAKKEKTRFSAQPRKHKNKKKGSTVDPFAPPPPTKEELATQQVQDQPLGLNGDTSKVKKKNPRKEGPKRRMSNEKKEKEQTQPATPAPAASTTPATTGSTPQSTQP